MLNGRLQHSGDFMWNEAWLLGGGGGHLPAWGPAEHALPRACMPTIRAPVPSSAPLESIHSSALTFLRTSWVEVGS